MVFWHRGGRGWQANFLGGAYAAPGMVRVVRLALPPSTRGSGNAPRYSNHFLPGQAGRHLHPIHVPYQFGVHQKFSFPLLKKKGVPRVRHLGAQKKQATRRAATPLNMARCLHLCPQMFEAAPCCWVWGVHLLGLHLSCPQMGCKFGKFNFARDVYHRRLALAGSLWRTTGPSIQHQQSHREAAGAMGGGSSAGVRPAGGKSVCLGLSLAEKWVGCQPTAVGP